jgi:hypothetical protein
MGTEDIPFYLAKAAECAERAEADPVLRKDWLVMQAQWLALAKGVPRPPDEDA